MRDVRSARSWAFSHRRSVCENFFFRARAWDAGAWVGHPAWKEEARLWFISTRPKLILPASRSNWNDLKENNFVWRPKYLFLLRLPASYLRLFMYKLWYFLHRRRKHLKLSPAARAHWEITIFSGDENRISSDQTPFAIRVGGYSQQQEVCVVFASRHCERVSVLLFLHHHSHALFSIIRATQICSQTSNVCVLKGKLNIFPRAYTN